MKKVKTGVKIILFIVVAFVIFAGVNFLVRPFWDDASSDHNYDTIYGFYEEPENTIETVFLGTSVMIHGVSPMELYENYGICSYNLATEAQPMMGSYYWLEEAYRLHSETLDTVVLDVSRLKDEVSQKDAGKDSWYEQAFEYMKFSKVKWHFVKDFSDDFTEMISYMIPSLTFHNRWKELSEEDFLEYQYKLRTYDQGYGLRTGISINSCDTYSEISVPFYTIESNAEIETNSEDLFYFKQIIEFCDDHNICLVLVKTPQRGPNPWSDSAHNTVQSLADQYQLDFVDFNYVPYVNELDFNFATDTYDSEHSNYYGAAKITDWLGNYLIEKCGNRDMRDDKNYVFMNDKLEDYYREIIFSRLAKITDPAEYLSYIMSQEEYAIFISVKDDASDSLTEEQRDIFKGLGLIELSQLPSHASYLSVIDDGKIVTEQIQAQDWEFINSVKESQTDGQTLYITYRGRLSDKTNYYIESGGYEMGNVSSIQIDGTEYSSNKRGLNIVVYDKKLKRVVNQAIFDTFASPERDKPVNEETLEEEIESDGVGSLSGKLLELYLYDRLCDDTKKARVLKQDTDKNNLTSYLQTFWDNEEFSIYMSGNGDISGVLDDSERKALADMGLIDLSEVEKGDSYIAVIQEGEILTEQLGYGGKDIRANGEFYKACSGETGEENDCSLIIQGTEYAGEAEGLNIVIYDNILNQVVDSTVYTTDRLFVSDG